MFNKDFVWGVASSAYQIEGRTADDAIGPSIWDQFIANGNTADGYDATTACDHVNRYAEDYALMRLLGIKAYRFSLSWPRIMPAGTGTVNEKAIALYRDMILEMKKNGVEPYITLFHWDLPLALYEKGGWQNEEIIEWFAAYARVVAENFSDICDYFITLNEPQCFVGIGHLAGRHAPGVQLAPKEVFQIAHNAFRAHGRAVIALREHSLRPIKIGYAPSCTVAYPMSDSPADIEAARKVQFGFHMPLTNWTWNWAWFCDPVFLGHYPEEGLKKFAEHLPEFTEADMKLIAQPLDFMGLNIYNGYLIKAGENGEPEFPRQPKGAPKTAALWPFTPDCFYWGVRYLSERYPLPAYITENGMSCHDTVSADGRVHDPNRIDFLDRYLGALQKAIADGADVRGYFVWSFLDLYEWEKGYTERFGLVYTDFVTQKRLVKDSAYWYKGVIDSRGQSLSINQPLREILYFTPEVKNLVWGKEEWTISAHEHGDVRVREGSFAGMSLSQLWQTHPEIFGGGQDTEDGVPCITNQRSGFPLLVKIITANEDLSIQVHPDDEYARQNENGANGKTECWYILDCEPDTKLVLGHNAGNHDELKNMITENRFDELIREVPIKPGDFIQIEPGTVHAIKGGTRLLEIQQSSDITYRLYDYGRVVEGKSRPLHLRQALEVIKNPCVAGMPSGREEHGAPLISCDYYTVWELEVSGTVSYIQDNDYSFLIVCVIEGDGLIDGQQIRAGDHFILPYGYGKAELMGEMRLVLARAGSANCAS